jgi:hypothetical protein
MPGDIQGWGTGVVDWLVRNEWSINIGTLWAVAIGLMNLSLVKLVSWAAVRHQHDRTSLGPALKRQKLSEGVFLFFLSVAYFIAIYTQYTDVRLGIWGSIGIRVIIVIGIVFAVMYGWKFVSALKRERWGQL